MRGETGERDGRTGMDHAADKRLLRDLLLSLEGSAEPALSLLDRYCAPDCVWEVFHPFNTLQGNREAAERFWQPLRRAMPDHEVRLATALAGEYEGRAMVSAFGQILGTFDAPLLGIPPTHGLATLRIGLNGIVADGRFTKLYVLLDLVDLMRQAGHYPFRAMPGAAEPWAFPPCDTGATLLDVDLAGGGEALRIVHEMQMGLPRPEEIASLSLAPSRHSHHWHPRMNWYGPAGIGSMRGERGFRDLHGSLFLQAFPDRTGFPREPGGPQDAPGHYVRLGDGRYAVTGGWPSLVGTHTGPEWLGLPPTGRRITMRVADWYRLDGKGRIVDNWVMMDVPDILQQMGLDLLHDLEFAVDRSRPRWPLT